MKMTGWIVIGCMGCMAANADNASDPGSKAPPAAGRQSEVAETGKAGDGEAQSLLAGGRQALTASKWAEALALFEKAARLEPDNNEAAFGLSVALIQLGRMEEALPLLERLRKAAPDNPMVMNNLAWVYVKSKDPASRKPAEAIKLARAAMLEQPSDFSIWNTLAEAYYADGNYASALRAAQNALRLSRLAGVTNDAVYVELVSRCRRAGSGSATPADGDDKP